MALSPDNSAASFVSIQTINDALTASTTPASTTTPTTTE
jgi:hypothetical protein